MLKPLAYSLAVSRAAFGIGYLAAPQRVSEAWVGRAGRLPQTTLLSRSLGARDLALGGGGLVALTTGGDARTWFAAQAVSDTADLLATFAARRHIPSSGFRLGAAMAGGSAVIAAAVALGLRDADQSGAGSDSAAAASSASTTPPS